jgi:WD40 repeat protein
MIVSGSNDCKIKVWCASTGECLQTLVGHEALVRALSFDSRSGHLVSASYDKTVKLWDLRTGTLCFPCTFKAFSDTSYRQTPTRIQGHSYKPYFRRQIRRREDRQVRIPCLPHSFRYLTLNLAPHTTRKL